MAATSVGEIGLDLVVNQKQFNRQMSGITGLAKRAGAALGAAFAVKKVVSFGKECMELGSDLNEVQNVVDVTFPHMAAKVNEFAKTTINSFGISETMAKKFTGTFGAMAKSFGFTEKQAYEMGSTLTGLAGDIASFYNISQDEAYTKLKSVFTGETESLKDLGVVMTQSALDAYALANGFGKTTKAMNEAEKVALRYQFVQSKLSAAQGDFSRTSGSWANQVRILKLQLDSLKATIGQGLINLFTPIIRVVNTLLGKLTTLANAFKSFTELITGNKSSGNSSIASPVADLAGTADSAGEGLSNASEAADDLSNSTKGAGKAAKKAAKEMRALMGFDQINKLEANPAEDNADTGSGSPSTDPGTGILGEVVDYGKLAEGETVVDKVDKRLEKLIERAKELAKLFKRGFHIGFGDSERKIASITKHIKGIGKNLKDIFTDKSVISSANRLFDALALNAGKVVGSIANIGLTIADNLVGGIDKYLRKSRDFIKNRIISMLDVSADIASLAGNFAVAIAEIFSVFAGDNAKNCTASIIGIFADAFLGITDLALQFSRDIIDMITTPFVENADGIRLAIDNTLAPISVISETLHQSVIDTFSKFQQVYDEHIGPMFNSFRDGLTSIVNTLLEAYNTYIAPVLDELAAKFDVVWKEYVQPVIDKAIELLGKIADLLTAIWEEILKPFIEWAIKNIVPIIGRIMSKVGTFVLDLFATFSKVFGGILDILGGFIDFLTGVFTNDNELAWKGIQEIVEGFKTAIGAIFGFIKEKIFEPFSKFLRGVFEKDWTESFGVFGTVLNDFFDKVEEIWGNIQGIFEGIIEFVSGVFTGNWERAWQGVQDIFGNIFEGLVSLVKSPLNRVIDLINGLIDKLNGFLRMASNALSFNIGFNKPSWMGGGRIGWKHTTNLGQLGHIPHLADGGFVKRNTPQLAMIGDNRHQGEVVAPEDKLREMAMEAVKAAGNSGITRAELEQIINNAVMRIVAALGSLAFLVDGEELAKAVMAGMESIDGRFNPVKIT